MPEDRQYVITEKELPALNDETIRASVVAHAIRLGKCPPPGTRLGFSFQSKLSEDEDAVRRGDLSQAKNISEKQWAEITVTQQDIDNGKRLINRQQITYQEPKTSIMKLDPTKK